MRAEKIMIRSLQSVNTGIDITVMLFRSLELKGMFSLDYYDAMMYLRKDAIPLFSDYDNDMSAHIILLQQ